MEEGAEVRVGVTFAGRNALIGVWLAGEQLENAIAKTASAITKIAVRIAGTPTRNRGGFECLIEMLLAITWFAEPNYYMQGQ